MFVPVSKALLEHGSARVFIYISRTLRAELSVATETGYLLKLKTFTIWPFAGTACQPLFKAKGLQSVIVTGLRPGLALH